MKPEAFLQWKNTDACFDFYCTCGKPSHFDGYFAYRVKCCFCGTLWRMPHMLLPVVIEDDETPFVVTEP